MNKKMLALFFVVGSCYMNDALSLDFSNFLQLVIVGKGTSFHDEVIECKRQDFVDGVAQSQPSEYDLERVRTVMALQDDELEKNLEVPFSGVCKMIGAVLSRVRSS